MTASSDLRRREVPPLHLSRSLAFCLVALPFVIALSGLVSALTGHDAWYSVEDGPAENTQFVFLVAAAVVAALIVRRTWRTDPLLAMVYAMLAAGLVVVAGEEISWGQRLLGIETPPSFAEENIQGELNLHNTYLLTPVFQLAQFGIGVVGIVLPFVRWPWAIRARWGRLLSL